MIVSLVSNVFISKLLFISLHAMKSFMQVGNIQILA